MIVSKRLLPAILYLTLQLSFQVCEGNLNDLLISRIASSILREQTVSDYVAAPKTTNKIRPIIFMHGIFGVGNEVKFAEHYIPKKVPGTVIYSINLFQGFKSAMSMSVQLKRILPAMQKIMNDHRDTGVTLLCYSQGGVICRAAVEMLSDHNVHTFIALSSPLNGQFGVTSFVKPFASAHEVKTLWGFWYTGLGQWISIGSYWNDPHHQKEFSNPKTNILLAKLNNQTGHAESQRYKNNFLKLKRLVMIGGPNDTVITPWQSAHLGFYDQNENVQPFENQPWYVTDDFGLRTLNEAGGVIRHTYPGVHHTQWYKNAQVFDKFIIPYIS